jgi:hypothetical protein
MCSGRAWEKACMGPPTPGPCHFLLQPSAQTPAPSLPKKKAQGPHQPSPPPQTHGAACTEVLWRFLPGSGPLRPPGHQAQTRSGLWNGGSPLSPRRRRTGVASYPAAILSSQSFSPLEYLHSFLPTLPPGTSPSRDPSSESLLLLPRPGLVRKEPGQLRNLCG